MSRKRPHSLENGGRHRHRYHDNGMAISPVFGDSRTPYYNNDLYGVNHIPPGYHRGYHHQPPPQPHDGFDPRHHGHHHQSRGRIRVHDAAPLTRPDQGKMADEKPRKTVKSLWNKHADRSSIVGLPYIQGSKSIGVKVMWMVLLMGAIGAMIWHLYKLVETYLEYEKTTKISYSFDKLPFPAITLCNINPMKGPSRGKVGSKLREVIREADPERLTILLDKWRPSRSRRGQNESETLFLDDINVSINTTEIDFSDPTFKDSWQASSEPSQSQVLQEEFRRLFSQETSAVREEVGHSMDLMLMQCSFAGRKCYSSDFKLIQTSRYGNCYELNNDNFESRTNGPEEGLEMILDLETDEYLPGITQGKGLQVHIHEPNTLAFPHDEGFAINAGTENTIALTRVDIQRIGDPYMPDCTDMDSNFLTQYGKKYTRQQCQEFCLATRVRRKCECVDERRIQANVIIGNSEGLRNCRQKADYNCIAMEEFKFAEDSSSCGCNDPCAERKYDPFITSRQWPGEAYSNLLVEVVCKKRPGAKCQHLRNLTVFDKQQEFVKLKIFYSDLNYELREENEDYEDFQFYSDIGGVVGLWIGLSILSLFELVHLALDLMWYVCCGCGGNRNKKSPDAGDRYRMDGFSKPT